MRGASGIGMGTTIKHLRRTTSGAAGNGLGATMKYLRRTTSAAANNGLSTTIIPLCTAASFEVNSKPHTGERFSVRLCVGPELSRCVHRSLILKMMLKIEVCKIQVAYGFLKDIKGYHIHFWSSCNSSIEKSYAGCIVLPIIGAGGLRTQFTT
jgi:hypothetical protein